MRIKEAGYGQTDSAVEYWINNRCRVADLYPSERHFFVPAMKTAAKVLDIGCAAGGSAFFCRELRPQVQYIGLDNSAELIQAARQQTQNMTGVEFHQYDGYKIPFEDGQIDFCFSFGVFHHLNHWHEMMVEAVRVSSDKILFDIRMWDQETLIDSKISYQKLALGSDWDQESIIPYNLISRKEVEDLAQNLNKKGIDVKCYGYKRPPTELAVTPAREVYMLSVLLQKNSRKPKFEMQII